MWALRHRGILAKIFRAEKPPHPGPFLLQPGIFFNGAASTNECLEGRSSRSCNFKQRIVAFSVGRLSRVRPCVYT